MPANFGSTPKRMTIWHEERSCNTLASQKKRNAQEMTVLDIERWQSSLRTQY